MLTRGARTLFRNRQQHRLVRRGSDCTSQTDSHLQSSPEPTQGSGRRRRPRKLIIPADDRRNVFDFVDGAAHRQTTEPTPLQPSYLGDSETLLRAADGRSFFVETYGCQMNTSDTEVVRSVLIGAGYDSAEKAADADVILLNTCAIREKAETRIWRRLKEIRHVNAKKRKTARQTVGVLGCMAERLKETMLEREEVVDVVAGPDAYRDLPRLLAAVNGTGAAGAAINVQLSVDETYGDIKPVRDGHSSVLAFTSIQRGCNNMCAFCIVPFTRGRERSRSLESVVAEVRALAEQGYREVTLLGQNVNSYFDRATRRPSSDAGLYQSAEGFTNMYRLRDGDGHRFADLLHAVAAVDPEMRIRFTSPHPKDFGDDVLRAIAEHPNICKGLHMPVQSGATAVLSRMRRGHSRESYLELVRRIRDIVPQATLSSDFIAGFCGETEADHRDTIALMEEVGYDQAFMFAYSKRDRTHAAHKMEDDVPADVKSRRLSEIIRTFRDAGMADSKARDVGSTCLVLVEGPSRRSTEESPELTGKLDGHKRVVFSATPVPASARAYAYANGIDDDDDDDDAVMTGENSIAVDIRPGDYVAVQITTPGVTTLRGTPLHRTSVQEYYAPSDSSVL